MHDFRDDYEMDEEGRLRKKKRVLPDGATMHIPMGFYDGRFCPTFADGSVDHTHWSRPGYRFADVNDEARLAADAAYEARSRRMETAWQRKGEAQADTHDATPPSARTVSLDELRAKAQQAWEARNERMRSAWRTSKEV